MKQKNITGWDGHTLIFRTWMCNNYGSGQGKVWDLVSEWNTSFADYGRYLVSFLITTGGNGGGGCMQASNSFRYEVHPIDGSQVYWVHNVNFTLTHNPEPGSVIMVAADFDRAPTEYSGELPYYGLSGCGDYFRITLPGSPTSTSTPIPTAPPPTQTPTVTLEPQATPTPSVTPTPTLEPTQIPTSTPTPTSTPAPTDQPSQPTLQTKPHSNNQAHANANPRKPVKPKR